MFKIAMKPIDVICLQVILVQISEGIGMKNSWLNLKYSINFQPLEKTVLSPVSISCNHSWSLRTLKAVTVKYFLKMFSLL